MNNLRVNKRSINLWFIAVVTLFLSELDQFYIIVSLMAIMLLVINWNNRSGVSIYQNYFKLFILPVCVIFIHSIFVGVYNGQMFFWGRSISIFSTSVAIVIFAIHICSYKKAGFVDVIYYAVLTKYLFLMFGALFSVGISSFFEQIVTLGSETLTIWLESHDIGLSMGFFVIYFLFFENKKVVGHWFKLITAMMIFLLCFKRIAIGALIVSCMYYLVLCKIKNHRRFIFITSLCIVVVCLSYVFLIKSGQLIQFFYGNGINPMGRDRLYQYFDTYYTFQISFLGRGNGFTGKVLTQLYNVGNALPSIALHSDVLRVYIEYGFIGAVLWYVYYPFIVTTNIAKIGGDKPAFLFLIFSIYAYIIYMTDNTTNYILFQLMYMLIPISVIKFEKSSKGVSRDGNQ